MFPRRGNSQHTGPEAMLSKGMLEGLCEGKVVNEVGWRDNGGRRDPGETGKGQRGRALETVRRV